MAVYYPKDISAATASLEYLAFCHTVKSTLTERFHMHVINIWSLVYSHCFTLLWNTHSWLHRVVQLEMLAKFHTAVMNMNARSQCLYYPTCNASWWCNHLGAELERTHTLNALYIVQVSIPVSDYLTISLPLLSHG